MHLLYRGISLNDCLEKASLELNLPKEKIDYNIIKKSNFFNKEFMVEVIFDYPNLDNDKVENHYLDNTSTTEEKLDNTCSLPTSPSFETPLKEYGASVKNGEILVYEDIFNKNKIQITPCHGITVYINNEKCDENSQYVITEEDIITYESIENDSFRKFNISISDDCMEAYLTVEYIPKSTYKLKDSAIKEILNLEVEEEIIEFPNKYTLIDIVKDLNKINVKSGVIIKNIKNCCLNGGENILIAKGTPVIDDTKTKIELLFDCNDNKSLYDIDEFKNLYSMSYVKTQDIIAKIIPGSIGEDGINIYGDIVKKLTIKNTPINVGDGCRVKNNIITSTTSGRPAVQNGVISVNPVYMLDKIDENSGDITFKGDIEVSSNITNNNKVISTNSILVKGNVLYSKLSCTGNIKIFKNVISSTLISGGKDLNPLKESYLNTLKIYMNELDNIINATERLLTHYPNKTIGELTKILIETRYKTLPKLSTNILTYNLKQGIINSDVLDFIKNKLVGLCSFKVSSIKELYNFKFILENEFKNLNVNVIIPSDVYISYTESSLIKSTKDTIISGKGSYNSEIRALSNIKFLDENAVAMRGTLYAGNHLDLKTVGSPSGIKTKLQVDEFGVITADKAYSNTLFTIGYKQYLLERPMRNIKVQLNSHGEIDIEGLDL